jgi:hypothetical protein
LTPSFNSNKRKPAIATLLTAEKAPMRNQKAQGKADRRQDPVQKKSVELAARIPRNFRELGI